jgi:Uma2 family endonuclease
MSPAGGETGNRNGRLTQQLFNWTDKDAAGIAFDSSTGFKLPNGAYLRSSKPFQNSYLNCSRLQPEFWNILQLRFFQVVLLTHQAQSIGFAVAARVAHHRIHRMR